MEKSRKPRYPTGGPDPLVLLTSVLNAAITAILDRAMYKYRNWLPCKHLRPPEILPHRKTPSAAQLEIVFKLRPPIEFFQREAIFPLADEIGRAAEEAGNFFQIGRIDLGTIRTCGAAGD